MGGGGVIGAVVAGIGAAGSRGFRRVLLAPPAEHSPRGMSCNVAAIVSAKSAAASSGDVSPVAVQRPEWAGWESDLVMGTGEPMPRLVFGPAPSFEEAKAATDELKDAVEKVYLSSPAAAGTAIAPPAPNHAVQAFKLLAQSPDVRNVVASVASDSNVWNAVWQNEAVVDFLQTHKSTVFEFPSEDSNMKNSVEDGAPEDGISLEGLDMSNANSISGKKVSGLLQHMKHAMMEEVRHTGNKVSGLFQYMKHAMEGIRHTGLLQRTKHATEGMSHAVEEMVSKASCLFQQIFGPKADGETVTDEAGDKEQGGSTYMETAAVQYFMGLAVLAIFVVLLKRA